MATNYPASADDSVTLPNPGDNSVTDSPNHAGLHGNTSDAIKALETKLGTGASTPAANQVLRGTGAGTSAYGAVNAATDMTGILPVANGGTGHSLLTSHGVLLGENASAITSLTPGTAGYILTSGGASADPAWIQTLPVANGGTGSTTAAGALTSLGAAANGANSDITSLSGLSTPLSVAQGGTGANLSATGGTSKVLKQTSVGGAVTVAQLAASDLSNGTTGSGGVVLATTPSISVPAWTTPTLGTGWTQWDAGPSGTTTGRYGFPRYFKDAFGIVHMDGLAKNNSGGSNTASTNALIFTLPAGNRPSHALRIVLVGNNSSDSLQEIDIDVDGSVKLVGVASIVNNQWISLNNIHFLAEA